MGYTASSNNISSKCYAICKFKISSHCCGATTNKSASEGCICDKRDIDTNVYGDRESVGIDIVTLPIWRHSPACPCGASIPVAVCYCAIVSHD